MAFRPTRACLGLFSRSRLPARIAAASQHNLNPAIVQRVRFRKAPWSTRKILGFTSLTTFGLASLYGSITVLDDDDDDYEYDKEDGELSNGRRTSRKAGEDLEGDDEEYDEDAGFFIPFPFTTKVQPVEYYAKDSPEIAAWFALNKDKEKMRKVQAALAMEVGNGLVRVNPQLGKLLRVEHMFHWEVPTFAPPTYEHTGLQITSSYIALTTKTLDPTTAKLQERVQYPKDIAESLWVFCKVAVCRELRPLAEKVGIQIGLTTEEKQLAMWIFAAQQKKNNKMIESGEAPRPGQPISGLTGLSRSTESTKSSTAGDDPNEGRKSMLFERFQIPSYAFLMKRSSLLGGSLPPRGAFRIVGHVELRTAKAYSVMLFVSAWYDPTTNKLVPGCTNIRKNHVFMNRYGGASRVADSDR